MDRNTWRKQGELIPLKVAAGTLIYGGHIVCVNAKGYAVPGPGVTTMGISDEMVDNRAGADGEKIITVWRENMFCLANDTANPVTLADVGKVCNVADSITVSKASAEADATGTTAGLVLDVSPDGVWVYI